MKISADRMASMLTRSSWLIVAMLGSLVSIVCPQKSFAADSLVTCSSPVVQLAAGRDGTQPRITILCTGGSSVKIPYFAYRISDNPNVATNIAALVGFYVQVHGPGIKIMLASDLSDLSGNSWGCGVSNCRIIDYLVGL